MQYSTKQFSISYVYPTVFLEAVFHLPSLSYSLPQSAYLSPIFSKHFSTKRLSISHLYPTVFHKAACRLISPQVHPNLRLSIDTSPFTRALSVACVLARPRQGTNSLVFGPYSRPYFSSHTHRRDLKQLPSKPSRREEANYNKRIRF